MARTAFLFPGQGSQTVGMGMDVASSFPAARRVFEVADRILGFSLSNLIKQGPEEELKQTINTQPAIITTSIAILEVLLENGIEPNAVAGHSIGEYAALYCAGVLSMEDCISLARSRGEYMHEAGLRYPGSLSAVIGLDTEKVEEICKNASSEGIVVVANLNCPAQIVISGELGALEKAGRLALEAGAMKVIPLTVSAAFHSPLMNEAAEKLSAKLDSVKFNDARVPVYCNVTAEPIKSGEEIRSLMKKQITSQVLWEKIIRKMLADGMETFFEVGPGTALAGMMKRIDRKVPVEGASSLATVEKIIKKYAGQPSIS